MRSNRELTTDRTARIPGMRIFVEDIDHSARQFVADNCFQLYFRNVVDCALVPR